MGKFRIHFLYIITICFCLVGCRGKSTTLPTKEGNTATTSVSVTTQALATIVITETAIYEEPSSTPSPFLSATPLLTFTPFPPKISSLLQGKCEKVWENPTGPGMAYGLRETYGNEGCKLPIFSPDKEYLAYATLSKPDDANEYLDTVQLIRSNSETYRNIHVAHTSNHIQELAWSPRGQLIVVETVWEGPWVVFVYDPRKDAAQASMWLNQGDTLQWNSQHSAFYAKHTGEYGPTQCIQDLGGYDSETGLSFPNLYQLFGITEKKKPFFGIPSGESDQLSVEPLGWSKDGKRLWLTVTTLKWDDGQYLLGPREAGMLELTPKGVSYQRLAADPHYNYSFEGLPEPTIVSQAYQAQVCPKP